MTRSSGFQGGLPATQVNPIPSKCLGALKKSATKTERFSSGRRAAQQALANRNTPAVLGVLFNRIYALRNQVMHGGATWNSSVNRDQLRDCSNLLGKLVPVIILLMLDNPETLWGDACYPVVA